MLALFIFTIIIFLMFKHLFTPYIYIIKSPSKTNIPNYNIIYADQKGDFDRKKTAISEIIASKKYGLRGKPDLIYSNKSKTDLIPIELKSGDIHDSKMPYEGDLMQLVAYFLMIEEHTGIKPKIGKIIYNDFMFEIKNTKELQSQLINILDDMRDMMETGQGEADASFIRCKNCICKGTVCEYAIMDK